MFKITNPSRFLLRAKVRCTFKVYGEQVENHNDFNGKNTWYIFPQQTNQGWFEISSLLALKGKTINQIKEETTVENKNVQMTMDFEIFFRDEIDNERKLPKRKYSFSFREWVWIPVFTEKDDWVIN